MTVIESAVKYGSIFSIGSTLTVGGICGLIPKFGFYSARSEF